jgi:nitrous oxidase accessory protein
MRWWFFPVYVIIFAQFSFAATINVPGDSATIQSAVNGANPDDTIAIAGGTYQEHVVIDKSLTLIGQDRVATIIDGSNTGDVVLITADYVKLKDLSIINSGDSIPEQIDWEAGVELYGVSNCVMEYCLFYNNGGAGLAATGASQNSIQGCSFTNNYAGIYFYEAEEHYGIDNLENTIIDNIFINNLRYGIKFEHTGGLHHTMNTIQENFFGYSLFGISMIMSEQNDISFNNFNYHQYRAIDLWRCMGGGDGNIIHHNAFVYNNDGGVQAFQDVMEGYNFWYDPDLDQGNYWSDYTGPDDNLDGIGDVPYVPAGYGNYPDFYPLMALVEQDNDSIIDIVDNCPTVYNPDQSDIDGDGIGDVCDDYACGDSNGDGDVNVGDAVYDINYVFNGGPPPVRLCAGDANGDGGTNVGDTVYLIAYVFNGGPEPVDSCCDIRK